MGCRNSRETSLWRLRPSGGYRKLQSFQVATLIYDGTVAFCDRFVDRRSRTHDQMVQAARSGRQNIAEGNRAGATSGKTEIHLTNVARGSLEELLLDFEDYLRQRKLALWSKQSPEAQKVRKLGQSIGSARAEDLAGTLLNDPSDAGARARAALYAPWLEHPEAAVFANTLICLIHQANYLLDRQLLELEKRFVEEGGFSETLAAARIAHRQERKDQRLKPASVAPTDQNFPLCPQCGALMALRTARQGKQAGAPFWGCTAYPDCKGTRKC